MLSILRFNFAVPGLDPAALAASYEAGIEMVRAADDAGFAMATFEEHHGADNGWSPAPLVTAAAVVGATRRLRVVVQALIVPLHDPVRLAEDLAVLDLMGGGRVTVVAGLGYRPSEYEAFGRDFARRGALLDASLETILAAWTGEPFTYEGRQVRVTPVPRSPAAQLLWVGGGVPASARRAARFGLPLCPPDHLPELAAYYREQCRERGVRGFAVLPPADTAMVHVAEDPDRAWAQVGPHFLAEARMYADWQQPGQHSAIRSGAGSVEELRAEGRYRVLTPAECAARATDPAASGITILHPLCGGMPPELGWESLRLYTEKVLPQL